MLKPGSADPANLDRTSSGTQEEIIVTLQGRSSSDFSVECGLVP